MLHYSTCLTCGSKFDAVAKLHECFNCYEIRMGLKEMETLYCIFCDNKVSERICFNCNEYKGVVTESEYKELQKEWGLSK
jgi:hypothetical protein